MGFLARRWALVVVLCCLAWTTPIHAQPEREANQRTPTDQGGAVRGAARFLANQGDLQLHAGRFERALQLFEMAEALFHAPTLVLVIAQTEKQLGRLRASRTHFQEVIDEKLPRGASPEFVQARRTAREELASLDEKIPRLTIVVEGARSALEVRVDGGVIPAESLGKPLLLDPGDHHVVALFDGATKSASITLDEGDRESVSFDFSAGEQERGSRRRSALIGPLLVMGVGTVAMVFGAVTGARALDEADQVLATCTLGNQQCDPAARNQEDSARNLAAASTLGFVIGGVGIAAGTVWLSIVASQGGAAESPDEGVPLRAGLGADGLWLGGSF